MTAVHRLHHRRSAPTAMMVTMDDGAQHGGKVLVLPPAPDAIELRHLRAFVAVAEELNFGRAATRLFVSQPALSRQIRSLERLVGCDLLRRSTHRVELTLAGDALLDRAVGFSSTWTTPSSPPAPSAVSWNAGWPRPGNR